MIPNVNIDHSHPWGFFDGASQNKVFGGGDVLFLSESQSFSMALGLGEGSNNYAESMSLKFLIFLPLKRNVTIFLFLEIQ